jgi:aryl-alcohol dehydrogenase-like predicted oxidoreductase
MKYRRFGKTELMVSELGFGCSRLAGTSLERKNQREVLYTLAEAFDSGVNFYDTADAYGQGRSEEILGAAFRKRRTKVIIATKAGYRLSPLGGFAARLKPYARPLLRAFPFLKERARQIRSSEIQQDFSSSYLATAIDQSLRRLRTDYIDLFQLHNPPASAIASGDFLSALEQAQAAGKIRWYGVSCSRVEDATPCFRYPGIAAIQVEMNLRQMRAADFVVPEARKRGISIIAREPYAGGAILGENSGPDARQLRVQSSLQAILSVGGVSVVIPGMSSRPHLRENLRALEGAFAREDIRSRA